MGTTITDILFLDSNYDLSTIMLVIMMVGIAIDGIIFKRIENKVMSRWGLR